MNQKKKNFEYKQKKIKMEKNFLIYLRESSHM